MERRKIIITNHFLYYFGTMFEQLRPIIKNQIWDYHLVQY